MADAFTWNEVQKEAIFHETGPMMVLAGPGSGKTFVITNRIIHLIRQSQVEASEILVITFTKAAALEMKQRFVKAMGNQVFPVNFGTFHAVFYHILKQSYHYDAHSILSEQEKRQRIQQILQNLQNHDISPEELLTAISLYKNGVTMEQIIRTLPDVTEEEFLRIYQSYQQHLQADKKLDFDDMVLQCLELFQKRPDILAGWQERFRYILIDEFQDINKKQYEVICMLAAPLQNIFIVGDDDQSIYGFRGADPAIMKQFTIDYKDAKTILLDRNYRCSGRIVAHSLKVINENKNRFSKTIHAHKEMGEEVKILSFKDKKEEYIYLKKRLQELQHQKKGETSAVIFRTNMEMEYLARILRKEKIPYIMKEKVKSIYEHTIAQDIRHYLMFAAGDHRRHIFLQIMNKPLRYISRDAVRTQTVTFTDLKTYYQYHEKMQETIDAMEKGMTLLNKFSPYLAVQYIRKGLGYDRYIESLAGGNQEKWKEYLEIMNTIQESTKDFTTAEEWLRYVEQSVEQWKEVKQQDEKEEGVHLMTMHGSKGLEYDTVFLPDLNEGICPHGHMISEQEEEEERRMFYVGMTRAKEVLELFYLTGTKERPLMPSRFLNPFMKQQKKKE